MKVRTLKYRTFTVLVGIALLAILLFLLIPLSYGISLPFVYWVHQFLLFALLIALTFVNTRWLAPKYLFSRRFFMYYSILFGACILIILLLRQTELWLHIPDEMRRIAAESGRRARGENGGLAVSFYIFLVEILVLGVNISGIIVKKWEEEKSVRLEVEKDKIEMELSFLKSQINPHFFFNSLNMVNALTYTDVEQARRALKKLGKIMRYVLYNTASECSPLAEEIEFVKVYIEMMKMRMPERVTIDFSTNITNGNRRIAPMLFLSLIENCFKHGVSTQVDSPIYIRIEDEGQDIIFHSKNKVFERIVDNGLGEKQNHGIGLKNTRRRLDLTYPNHYSLVINRGDTFEVILKIAIDENKMCNRGRRAIGAEDGQQLR